MKQTLLILPLIALSLSITQAAPSETTEPAARKAADLTSAGTAATENEGKTGDAVADNAARQENTEQMSDGNLKSDGQNAKAVDATLRLREKLASIDRELSALSNPTRSLQARCKSRKDSINAQLERLDKVAMEVAALQERFNSTNNMAFEFTIVHGDDRDRYMRDGKAAHAAMLVDMKEKKSSRKIGGLDKFEIMRDRYQGMPEYKSAAEWYNRTIDDLEKRWSKMQAGEKMRRDKMQAAKRQRMDEDDERDFRKLESQLKAEGEDIAKVWYIPSARNLRMLNNCLNKIHDVQRRRESFANKISDNVGCVPPLLSSFWEMMDCARELLLNGDLTGALNTINEDTSFNKIVRLNRNVMPDEYKEPLKEQRQELVKEIRRRETDSRSTRRSLELKIAELERNTSNIEARIDALLEEIERERGVDAGENTATVADAEMDTPEKSNHADQSKDGKQASPQPEDVKGK